MIFLKLFYREFIIFSRFKINIFETYLNLNLMLLAVSSNSTPE